MILNKGFFQLARNASLNSEHRVKIGCVIALHGKPVSVGWNVVKTHPVYTRNSLRESIHAEIKVVIAAQCDLRGGVAYVYREIKHMPALARPCNFCASVLKEVGIKSVFYTIGNEPYWKKERL